MLNKMCPIFSFLPKKNHSDFFADIRVTMEKNSGNLNLSLYSSCPLPPFQFITAKKLFRRVPFISSIFSISQTRRRKTEILCSIETNNYSTNARPTLSLLWWASWKACRSRRRRSSNLKVACRRWAAALAPGPRWASLSIRQIAWALTTAILVARLVSPITLPRRPSASPSQPRARPNLAHLASAKHLSRLWRSEDRSPQGPATNLPSSNPPRDLNLETRGPGFGPAGAARDQTSRKYNVIQQNVPIFQGNTLWYKKTSQCFQWNTFRYKKIPMFSKTYIVIQQNIPMFSKKYIVIQQNILLGLNVFKG